MAVTAITGEIGSGKSTAAKLLAKLMACECFDADRVAKECWTFPHVKAEAVKRWGNDILDEAGSVIMPKVAQYVFASKSDNEFCNKLIHPLVMHALHELTLSRSNTVLEIPLLPEAGRPEWIDRAVYVEAEFQERAERCRIQRGWSVEELGRRESLLLPKSERINVCDCVINNNGDIKTLTTRLEEFIREY